MSKKPTKKPGNIFVIMEASRKKTLSPDNEKLLGVFQPKAYIVIIKSGYIYIEVPEDGNAKDSDISQQTKTYFRSDCIAWYPEASRGDISKVETELTDNEFLLPVDLNFISTHAPKSVSHMIYCAICAK